MNRTVRFVLAGLETGISGALAMLAWLAVPSLWTRRTVWWIPNLFASAFAHERFSYFRFSSYTAAGLALDLFVYGLFGCVFGLVWRDQRGGARLLWAGILIGLGTWYLLFRIAWRSAGPAVSIYSPDRQLLIGSLIYGVMLTRYPRVAARLEAANVG